MSTVRLLRHEMPILNFQFGHYMLLVLCLLEFTGTIISQPKEIDDCNIVWESQSKNSSGSMPLGGGDIGMNVWVENDQVFFYLSRSGTFDENNTLLKLGRVRLEITPNPFIAGDFRQELNLRNGNILITGSNALLNAEMDLWVEVFRPVAHIDLKTSAPTTVKATYENWRYEDRVTKGKANYANSWKWVGKEVLNKKDHIMFEGDKILFFHQNTDSTIFDITVNQQKLGPLKDQLYNPLKYLIFGGYLSGENMSPAGQSQGTYVDTDFKGWSLESKQPVRDHQINITLQTLHTPSIETWKTGLKKINPRSSAQIKKMTSGWWKDLWDRSFIFINRSIRDSIWQTARNYQLFRYMLGCNAYGSSPTKFNGGLFTYDPSSIDSTYTFSPDHRNWGGGVHTAQNQRLVYFPMLKSGDLDMMIPQFDFYLKALKNAELRSQYYWGHEGACFTEQIENFGLPNYAEYGSKRPENYDPGMQYNPWLEYQWDTVLEFCLMILETESYGDKDISRYIPLIESSLTFFDEHYQYLANQRGSKTFDENGDLILYPGSSCETYKMAYNATSTAAALQAVLKKLLQSRYLLAEARPRWEAILDHIPPLSFREFDSEKTIAPAKLWERVNNTEAPQLYPVFPWGIYGVGKPDLEVAINTYNLDPDVQRFKSYVGWKQYNIWAARLGMTEEAASYTLLKLKDSGRRFPAFWGPGFDWVPDHNWGGSGAIGLQEMLLQTDGDTLLLFPAWPNDWDVHFKLHAPENTTVEAKFSNGSLSYLKVTPKSRERDIINLLQENR